MDHSELLDRQRSWIKKAEAATRRIHPEMCSPAVAIRLKRAFTTLAEIALANIDALEEQQGRLDGIEEQLRDKLVAEIAGLEEASQNV